MLHVWIMPVWLLGANADRCRRGCGSNRNTRRHGVMEPRRGGNGSGTTIAHGEGFLIGRICADDLLSKPDQDLIVVHAITHAHGGATLAERIPGNTEPRSKIHLRCFDDLFAVRRSRRRTTIGRRLHILRVDNHAVAEVSGADDTITGAGNLRSIRRIEKARIESREPAVLVERLAEI